MCPIPIHILHWGPLYNVIMRGCESVKLLLLPQTSQGSRSKVATGSAPVIQRSSKPIKTPDKVGPLVVMCLSVMMQYFVATLKS